jgi:PIN domain nuclease of toxin-antitoxin system
VRLLLDTHALLWWLDGDRRLSARARAVMADETNEILVSAASGWEIATKSRLGKLALAAGAAARLGEVVVAQGFTTLPITLADALRAGALPGRHGDPFDRMLAAQALDLGIAIISRDRCFDMFGVVREW